MATTKHATIRYQTLDRCFRNPGRKYFINDLVDACNVAISSFDFNSDGIKRRQLFEDMRFMESDQGWSIPLERYKEGRKVYYRYYDLKFSINNQPLNESEANQLKETLLLLSRFKGLPHFEWMDEMIARLDSGLGLTKDANKIIEFEQNQYLKGLDNITPVYNAILYNKAISISYKSFKTEKPIIITFHSYYLKQFNNRWFAFGLNDEFKTLQNLALDRIVSIKDSKTKYIKNKNIDFAEYFEDVVGVSVKESDPVEKISIKISKELWPYIKTKPIHGSQKVKKTENDSVIIQLVVKINYELESLLLSFGENIEIISPPAFRTKLMSRISAMNKKY